MKLFKYMTIAAAALMCLWSCEREFEKTQLATEGLFVAPSLYPQSDVVVDSNNSKVEAVVFHWTPADFGAATQIEYDLYLTANGWTTLAGQSFTNSLAISKTDLNGLLVNELGVLPNEIANVGAYIEAYVYGTDSANIRSANTISFNVTTYAAELRSYYLCGEFQAISGSKSWDIDHAVEFFETDGGTNIYKILVDLTSDGSTNPDYSYFKVTAQRNWSGDNWGYNFLKPNWECPEQNDSNLSVPVTDGAIYILTVNLNAKEGNYVGAIEKELVDGVGMCGAYNGWTYASVGDTPLTYDANQNVWISPAVTFTDDGGLGFLIRLNTAHNVDNWNDKYGTAGAASQAIAGGIELVQGGGDCTVPAAGTYVMKVYTNRTPYVIVMEKQ